jgi:DNA modification methylase
MATLPERWFHCCVTSPPYFGLRDYGIEGQIGLEPTPDDFVAAMVEVGRGVRSVLRDDGVFWLNLGDSYASKPAGNKTFNHGEIFNGRNMSGHQTSGGVDKVAASGLKPKDLIGVPWRAAFALQSDGWYLRDAIIWHKPAPMPGSQLDRCTFSYEYIFQLTKKPRYYFDLDAIKEPLKDSSVGRLSQDVENQDGSTRANGGAKTNGTMKAVRFGGNKGGGDEGSASRLYSGNAWKGSSFTNGKTGAVHDNQGRGERNEGSVATPRNVWTMASGGYKDSHFATFPIALPLRCTKASTSEKGCCPDCGAPWERITERTKLKRERPNELTKRTGENGTGNHCANTVAGVESKTLGWQPTCKCGREDIEPCRVLDPFNGAGTTAVACRRLGLDYTGCELNPEYIEMTHKRLRAEQNRGADMKPVKSVAGQKSLF